MEGAFVRGAACHRRYPRNERESPLAIAGRRQSASKRKSVLLLCIFVCAITGWLAMGERGNASDDLKHIKSITFAGRTIDRAHSIRWQSWTIGFGSRRPFAEFNEQGMTLRGLSCANAKVATTKCHLLMSMKPFESFAHFCELSPDDHDAAGSWTTRVDCPNEIKFDNRVHQSWLHLRALHRAGQAETPRGQLGPVAIEAMRVLKQALDPQNIFNPGKIVPAT